MLSLYPPVRFILLCGIALQASADEALAPANRERVPPATTGLVEAACGPSVARDRLGNGRLAGDGVAQSYRDTDRRFHLAAEYGHVEAQFPPGIPDKAGLGTDQDAAASFGWLKRSARAGSAGAQHVLTMIYSRGSGPQVGRTAGAYWYALAADQGVIGAQYELGRLYLEGADVSQDARRAAEWLSLAAAGGCAEAQYALGTLYLQGNGVPRNNFVAVEWFYRAANQGHGDAQYSIGVMYAQGIGVMRRERKAEAWLRKAATGGHELARRKLAELMKHRVEKLRNYPLPDLRRVRNSLYG